MRSVRGANVAVIGGAGFLGSHLVNCLIQDYNCKVTVVDNLVSGRREFIHSEAKFVHGDVTDSEAHLFNIFVGNKIQFCFNYSAYPYIPDSFTRPLHVFNVTCFGAMKVINAAQAAGCEAILQVSSAEIYGEGATQYHGLAEQIGSSIEPGRICEFAPIAPRSTYGVAKAAVDNFVQVRWREAKTPCIALRQFNCVGERDVLHPYVLIEIYKQLRKFNKGDNCTVYLGNNSTRDFQYAGDAVNIVVKLLENGNFGEVYNSGSERSIKIYDLAKLVG